MTLAVSVIVDLMSTTCVSFQMFFNDKSNRSWLSKKVGLISYSYRKCLEILDMEYNFKKYRDGSASTHGEPYDLKSVMHYSRFVDLLSFNSLIQSFAFFYLITLLYVCALRCLVCCFVVRS